MITGKKAFAAAASALALTACATVQPYEDGESVRYYDHNLVADTDPLLTPTAVMFYDGQYYGREFPEGSILLDEQSGLPAVNAVYPNIRQPFYDLGQGNEPGPFFQGRNGRAFLDRSGYPAPDFRAMRDQANAVFASSNAFPPHGITPKESETADSNVMSAAYLARMHFVKIAGRDAFVEVDSYANGDRPRSTMEVARDVADYCGPGYDDVYDPRSGRDVRVATQPCNFTVVTYDAIPYLQANNLMPEDVYGSEPSGPAPRR